MSEKNNFIESIFPIILVGLFLLLGTHSLSTVYPNNYHELIYGTNFALLLFFIYATFFYTNFPQWLNHIIYKKTNLMFLLIMHTNLYIMKKIKLLMLLGVLDG